jgi:hypothetical protein
MDVEELSQVVYFNLMYERIVACSILNGRVEDKFGLMIAKENEQDK